MNRVAALLLVAIVCAGALPQRRAAAEEMPTTGCARYWGEARRISGSAFSHVVHVENTCGTDITCSVSTDVRPQATNVRVPAGKRIEMNTYFSSPYGTFTPRVDCDVSK